MSIYIYKECPPYTSYGSVEYSSCGGRINSQVQAADIARWHRDMGPTVTASANYWAYNQTKRGVYYTEWNFNGTLTGNDVGICHWDTRTFSGSGATGKMTFTPCGCDCSDIAKQCSGGFNAGCPQCGCGCEQFPQSSVSFSTGTWKYDTGCADPTYSCETHWRYPVFCLGPVCTADCMCNPFYSYWSQYWFHPCEEQTTRANWSFSGNTWSFTANWFWYASDYTSDCGNCCIGICKERCQPPNSHRCCNCCGCFPHDIWHKGQFTVTVTKGPKSSLKCAV
jgi:hypothetical protein